MAYLRYDGSVAAVSATPVYTFSSVPGDTTITGTGSPDGLWGSGGELMIGGPGDNTYYIQNAADTISQGTSGTNTIVAWQNINLTNYANIQNLQISGAGLYAAGNTAANVIQAGDGAEQLYGGGGQDVLVAGTGADTFIVVNGQGNDVIYGFKPGSDMVRLSAGYTDFSQVQAHLTQQGADVLLDMSGGNGLIFRGATVGEFTAANFELQLSPTQLGAMTFNGTFNGPLSLYDPVYNPTGIWTPDYGYQGVNGAGSYTLTSNNELEIYTSPYFRGAAGNFPINPFVSNPDGSLSIVAQPSTNTQLFGYGYTSGMISTQNSFSQTYGYFEIKAKVPGGAGTWPAFWMLPASGAWPPELDVMENLGSDPNLAYTTSHSAIGGNTALGQANFVPPSADGFHTYGVLWTPASLTWYIDGVEVFQTATPADMNTPMYMIANLALGGWAGPIAPGALPANYVIDYIHAYALPTGTPSPPVLPPSPTPATTVSTADASYTMPDGVNELILIGTAPQTGIGNAAADTIVSNDYGSTLIAGSGSDTLIAGHGADTLVGGAGADTFVFPYLPWNAGHVQSFAPGMDHIDLTTLFAAAKYQGVNPIADGYLILKSDGAGDTQVYFDPHNGNAWPTLITTINGIAPTSLTLSSFIFSTGAPPPPAAPTALSLGASSDSGAKGDGITSFNKVTINGLAPAGDTVTLYDGATVVGTGFADPITGAFALTTTALADGVHTLSATDANPAGTVSASSSPLAVTIDTQTPTVGFGGLAQSAVTSTSSTVTLTGTAGDAVAGPAGMTVSLVEDGKIVATTLTNASGAWSVSLSGVSAAAHVFTAQVADVAGNIGYSTGAYLLGASGGVTLMGTAGNDVFIGGPGDTLSGHGGADTFIWTTAAMSPARNGAFDKVTDFIDATDHLSLLGLGHLIDGGSTGGKAMVLPHEVTWYSSGGNTYVVADVNGDSVADFKVELMGLHHLTAADFVLG